MVLVSCLVCNTTVDTQVVIHTLCNDPLAGGPWPAFEKHSQKENSQISLLIFPHCLACSSGKGSVVKLPAILLLQSLGLGAL